MKLRKNLIKICLIGVFFLLLPVAMQAQYQFTTNNDGSLNIHQYTGSGGDVIIPDATNGLSVTSIGSEAFAFSTLMSVTIGTNVTSIGDQAFFYCLNLTSVYFQGNAPSLGSSVFGSPSFHFPPNSPGIIYPNCYYLPGTTGWGSTFGGCPAFLLFPPYICTIANGSVTVDSYTGLGGVLIVPNTIEGLPVSSIGSSAFAGSSLTSVTIPNSVTSIGYLVFAQCTILTNVFFGGNAPVRVTPPSFDWNEFNGDTQVTVYYLPGTTGWGAVFGDGPTAGGGGSQGGAPTALWFLPNPTILYFEPNFGVQTNCFGFTISWATNISVVVEACTDLANPLWSPIATNMLTDGTSYFRDSQWTNCPDRYFRLRSP